MGPVRPTLLFAPQRSPHTGELFGGCSSVGVVGRCVRPRLSPSRIAIGSPRLNNATSRIAAAGVVAIATFAIATVVRGHQHRGATQRQTQLMAHYYNLPARIPAVSLLLKPAASSSRCAGSTPHTRTASTPSSRTTCEPRNSPTLPSPAVEGATAQCHRLRTEMAAAVG
jgi:hypothetical protein